MQRSFWAIGLLGAAWTLCACGDDAAGLGIVDGAGAPDGPNGPPAPPPGPPPTGSKWEGIEVEGACGAITIEYVLVDEVCGGLGQPGYLDHFRSPMMRDGARIDGRLYAVDATNLWVLDATASDAMPREALLTGLGQMIAVAEHQGRLVIAAGGEGLVLLDLTDPLAPALVSQLDVGGPALDVRVVGDAAFVAAGESGLAIVDLSGGVASLSAQHAVPGFAAGVAARGDTAFVAACDRVVAIDVPTGDVLGQTWLAGAEQQGILIAPAKDIEIVGDVAFVAAGRFGAVAVDISDPAKLWPLGNCTIVDDLGFYASGVRAEGGRLFIAGGEWGVLPVDVTNPGAACAALVVPATPELPEDGMECSSEPPWEVVAWENSYAPTPPPPPPGPPTPSIVAPGRDPIQTLPFGDLLYTFGDASRIGFRAVDVRLADDPDLLKIGRYEEPLLAGDVAAGGGRVAVVGRGGGLFERSDTELLTVASTSLDPAVFRAGITVEVMGDGRVAIATADELFIEGQAQTLDLAIPIWPGSLTASENALLLPIESGALRIDADSLATQSIDSGRIAALPSAVRAYEDQVVIAAPEWPEAARINPAGVTNLPAHGVFDLASVMDASLWRAGLPRRLLAFAAGELVEVASLGRKAGLTVHGASPRSLALPPGRYVDAAASGTHVFLVTLDRGTYRSQLVTVDISGSSPSVTAVESFVGGAVGVSVDADRLYVADADGAVRVYELDGQTPELLGLVALEAVP